jgi:phosphoglycolate phosphatase
MESAMAVRLVVTDMDNTLYSWVDYIVPAVEAMVSSVCQATRLPPLRVIQALKAVYALYESNDYPFVLQESSLYAEFPEFGSFDRLVIAPAQSAFAEARRRYLEPYPGVIPTLALLRERGIPVVALTDAPRNPAEMRAKQLGLDGLLRALYTLPGFQFPRSDRGEHLVAVEIQRREEQGQYRAACPVTELPRDFEKPNPAGLLQICRDFLTEPGEVLFVGDSLRKDVALAQNLGAVDCWAEYGTYVSREYRERLETISARSITRRHAASVLAEDAVPIRPTHRLASFDQVLSVIDR